MSKKKKFFFSCWVHIIKHSWDYRSNLKWNQFVKEYIQTLQGNLWEDSLSKNENKEIFKIEIWGEYLFALDNIVRLCIEK